MAADDTSYTVPADTQVTIAAVQRNCCLVSSKLVAQEMVQKAD